MIIPEEVEFRNKIPGDGVLRRHRGLPVLQLIGAPRFGIYGAANFGCYLTFEKTGPGGCYCANDPLSTESGQHGGKRLRGLLRMYRLMKFNGES
jgi:hypothetical protein